MHSFPQRLRSRSLAPDSRRRPRQQADYARQLGYTEKSLARAVTATMGTTAKTFITARIVVEAKRLPVHTELSAATIAAMAGLAPSRSADIVSADYGTPP